MTIFIDGAVTSGLTSYEGLCTSIASYVERNDLATQIPDFVRLAEARFRRVIRSPDLETLVEIGLTGSTPLPVDFDRARLLTVPDALAPRGIEQVTPDEFYTRTRYPSERTVYALIAGNIVISPVPNAPLTANLLYTANLPSLGPSVQTNWLLAKHPDIYLFGALLEAEFFGWNDARLPTIKSAVDEALAELDAQANHKRYSGGPLVMRTDRIEASRGMYRR